jgi:hypothetical protein
MAKLISICENCGLIFPNPMFEIPESAEVGFSNISIVVPCPNCGKEVTTSPEGIFKSVKGVVQFLGAVDRTIPELQRFTRLVENAREEKQNATEFSAILDRELPEFSPISNFLLKNATTTNLLISFLGLILTAVGTIIAYKTYQESHQQKADIDPKIVINQTYNIYNAPSTNKLVPAKRISLKSKRVGVNKPCECGSGKKRKKCHR